MTPNYPESDVYLLKARFVWRQHSMLRAMPGLCWPGLVKVTLPSDCWPVFYTLQSAAKLSAQATSLATYAKDCNSRICLHTYDADLPVELSYLLSCVVDVCSVVKLTGCVHASIESSVPVLVQAVFAIRAARRMWRLFAVTVSLCAGLCYPVFQSDLQSKHLCLDIAVGGRSLLHVCGRTALPCAAPYWGNGREVLIKAKLVVRNLRSRGVHFLSGACSNAYGCDHKQRECLAKQLSLDNCKARCRMLHSPRNAIEGWRQVSVA